MSPTKSQHVINLAQLSQTLFVRSVNYKRQSLQKLSFNYTSMLVIKLCFIVLFFILQSHLIYASNLRKFFLNILLIYSLLLKLLFSSLIITFSVLIIIFFLLYSFITFSVLNIIFSSVLIITFPSVLVIIFFVRSI